MHWIPITSEEHLNLIIEKSATLPQVIFKHSTRCSTSTMVLNRLDRSPVIENVDFHFLDLLSHRELSRKIADTFQVTHESPQVLLIKDGVCIYDESHMGIQMDEISEQVS